MLNLGINKIKINLHMNISAFINNWKYNKLCVYDLLIKHDNFSGIPEK